MTEPHKIDKISYFKTGIKQTKPTLDIRAGDALNMISGGDYKDAVEKLRDSDNKNVRQTLKRDLGYFCFSGTFKKRAADSLIKHSGLICIDLDDVDLKADGSRDIALVNEVKDRLKADEYILAMFVSPSGNGLKLLIRIDGSKHLPSFLGIEKYFIDVYQIQIDQSGKDVSRACYVSYDPDIYINDNSTAFMAVMEVAVEIDYDTGEIMERSESLEAMVPKLRKSYDRALFVADEIKAQEKDITEAYQDWLELGMALSVFGEPGRAIFHEISQFNENYKPRVCDLKFDDLLRSSKFTSPAKFFSLAKAAGIEVRKTVVAEAAAPADLDSMRKEWTWNTPDGMSISEDLKVHALNHGFIEHKTSIFIAKHNFKDRKIDLDNISNYTVRPLFLIKSKADPKRLYEIKNDVNEKVVVDMPASSFKTMQNFTEIMEVQGNFLMQCRKEDFHTLKRKWFRDERTAEEIKTLGWHKDGFYAFANGIFHSNKFHGIDEYGMISKKFTDEVDSEYERNYFIPAMSEIYLNEDEEYENEKSFVYVRREVKWKDWAELFCKVHGENGRIAMLYIIASFFRDIVYARYKTFPHLLGFGPRGTGKSILGWSLTYMFGKERKPFNLNSGTAPGFYRTFAQFNNSIVWFDEFSNSLDLKRQEDLKNAYDGAGHIKGDWSAGGNSNRTVSTPVRSACYISGQELPISNPALFSRTILLEFTKSEFTQEEKVEAGKLIDMQSPGLSRLTAGLVTFREKIAEEFQDKFEKAHTKLKKYFEESNVTVMDRIIHNNAVLLAVYEILRGDIDFPFSDAEIWETIRTKAYKHNKLFSKSEETSQFWDMVQYLFSMGQIMDEMDFVVKHAASVILRLDRNETTKKVFSEPKDLLFLSLSRVHGLYMKTLRERGEKGMDKESLCHYLEHSRGYIGAVNSVSYGKRKSSGFVFDYEIIKSGGINLHTTNTDGVDADDVDVVAKSFSPAVTKADNGKQEDLQF